MSQMVADLLPNTQANEQDGGSAMEFTYRSGDRPLEGYTIKRGLGWGGFGEVYYAISDGGKEVALKLVQRYLDVELRGVTHCLNLKNPHLLTTFDVRRNDKGESWVVMEYMAGASLHERIDQCPEGLTVDETLHWLEGIASAADYLHEHGIVHRDLKPANIFQEVDTVKVGDYGLSKFISQSRRSGQTQSIGTVHYMAPEISTGNYDRGVDVYSTAVIAFEMLSGHVPFDGETAGEVLMKHLTAEPDLDKVDAKYHPIFAKALAKDPADRFRTVGELYAVLRSVALGHGSATIETAGAPSSAPPLQPARAEDPAKAPVAAQQRTPGSLDLTVSLPPDPGTFASKRRALSDLLWSMFLAGLLSAVLPILAVTGEFVLFEHTPQLQNFVSLAFLTGVSSWGILAFARYWEAHRVELSVRRMGMMLFGLALGAIALALNVWLGQQMPHTPKEVLYSVGRPIWGTEMLHSLAPFFAAYGTIFGFAFVLPDWAKSACSTREQRFPLGRVVLAGLLGVTLATLIQERGPDPIWTGSVLAMTVVIVQWVSPYRSRPKPRFAAR